MAFGKPSKWGKFYPGSSKETPWTQHCHGRMFIDQEDAYTDMCANNNAPLVRGRDPLDPCRKPDPRFGPPPNLNKVSQPTQTGIRHIGFYSDTLPTHRKSGKALEVMRELNETLGHDLYDLKRCLLDTTSRLSALERVTPARNHTRCKTAMETTQRHRTRRKQIKPVLWDPNLQRSLPVQTASAVSTSRRSTHNYPMPATGPLGMMKHSQPR